MAYKKFGQFTAASEVKDTDILLIHDGNGVKKITAAEFKDASGAAARNGIYRGKYLGDSLTAAQKAVIAAGTFDDMYIGDYWTIDGVNYRIAAFDYWLHCGDTECTDHHVVIVPDTALDKKAMNDSNITTGAYIGSKMYTTYLATAKATITAAFGSANLLSHREYMANAVASGRQSAGAWYDSIIDLMNEHMVYGGKFFEATSDGSNVPYVYSTSKSQLPLFQLDPQRIITYYEGDRAYWWLRSVVSGTLFAYVSTGGSANHAGASGANGVRPAFAIH